MIETTEHPKTQAFAIARTFDATIHQVWNAFTRPEHLRHWWGPKGCSIDISQFDLRPGGKFVYSMTFPGGRVMWGRFVFRQIAAPHRLVWVNSFSDRDGGVTPNPYIPGWPLETLTTVEFAEKNGKTTLSLTATPINCTEEELNTFMGAAESMNKGFAGTFDQLADYLPEMETKAVEDTSTREITSTRIFDAPRDLVFRLWTEPGHVVKWWGPNGFRTTIHKMDVRPNGEWVFTMHGPDGRDYPNHKVFLELVPPERIVYDHVSGPAHRMTVLFADLEGKTEVSVRLVFPTAKLRDHVVKEFNAAVGLEQTLNRLGDELARQ